MTAKNRMGVPLRRLALWLCLGVVAYQVALMWLWATYPALDWVLLRFSLSNADAIAFAALGLSLYAYWLYERTSEAEDMEYLQEFVQALRQEGLDPEGGLRDLARLMGSGARWWRAHEAEVRSLAPAARALARQAPELARLAPELGALVESVDVERLRRTLRSAAALAGRRPPA